MARLKTGTRLKSTVCNTEVIVVKAPAVGGRRASPAAAARPWRCGLADEVGG